MKTKHYLAVSRLDAANRTRALHLSDLSEARYVELKGFIDDLEYFKDNRKYCFMIMSNLHEVKQVLTAANTEVAKNAGTFDFGAVGGQRLFIEMNRRFLNFLSITRSYLDHTQTHLTRRFRDPSDELSAFRKHTAEQFDGKFAYRFFAKLRNYAQHCGMPVHHIGFSFEGHADGKSMVARLHFAFDRDKLLMGFDGWGSIVQKDLKKADARLEALPLIEEYAGLLMLVADNIEKTCAPVFQKAKEQLEAVMKGEQSPEPRFMLMREIAKDAAKGETTSAVDPFPDEAIALLNGTMNPQSPAV